MLRNNITEIAYNIQTTVDAKNNLPIDYKLTNQNDSKAMGDMLEELKASSGQMNSLSSTIKDSIPVQSLNSSGSGNRNHCCHTWSSIHQPGSKP